METSVEPASCRNLGCIHTWHIWSVLHPEFMISDLLCRCEHTCKSCWLNNCLSSTLAFRQSVLWFDSSIKQDSSKLQQTIRSAERIIRTDIASVHVLYTSRAIERSANISVDTTHPGNRLFRLLASGWLYRMLMSKPSLHWDSFNPQAIHLLNTMKISQPGLTANLAGNK